MLTIIIPAYNEADVISDCIQSLLAQNCQLAVDVIISANGCVDETVYIAHQFSQAFEAKGFSYRVIESVVGNKNQALNKADVIAKYDSRLYLDADVICSPQLLEQAISVLNSREPVYFSGRLSVPKGNSFFSNAYSMIWSALPYIRDAVTGIGCYGVNGAGRKLWGDFPAIHSDDKFVRMQFSNEQQIKIQAQYNWPVPQGLFNLIKVRARWIRGNQELYSRYPALIKRDGKRLKTDRKFISVLMRNPLPAAVFLFIYSTAAALALFKDGNTGVTWSRAR